MGMFDYLEFKGDKVIERARELGIDTDQRGQTKSINKVMATYHLMDDGIYEHEFIRKRLSEYKTKLIAGIQFDDSDYMIIGQRTRFLPYTRSIKFNAENLSGEINRYYIVYNENDFEIYEHVKNHELDNHLIQEGWVEEYFQGKE